METLLDIVPPPLKAEDAAPSELVTPVKECGADLRKHVADEKLTLSLKSANDLFWELRQRRKISDVHYCNLFREVMQEALPLYKWFHCEDFKYQKRLPELYEAVQHCNNVIPRMCMMIIVGSALMSSDPQYSGAVLKDVSYYLKSVQDPRRGCYVRFMAYAVLTSSIQKLCPGEKPQQQRQSWPPDGKREASTAEEDEDSGDHTVVDGLGTLVEAGVSASAGLPFLSQGTSAPLTYEEVEAFFLDGLENLSRLLTRFSYQVGGGTTGQLTRKEHEWIVHQLFKCMGTTHFTADRQHFHDSLCPKMLAYIRTLQDPHSQQLLLSGLIEGFPPELSLATLGSLIDALFRSSAIDIGGLFRKLSSSLSTLLTTDPLDVKQLPASMVDELVKSVEPLVQRSVAGLEAYVAEIRTAEVPHSVVPEAIVTHWVYLVHIIETAVCISDCENMDMIELLKLLLFRYHSETFTDHPDSETLRQVFQNATHTDDAHDLLTIAYCNIVAHGFAKRGLHQAFIDLARGLYAYIPPGEESRLSSAVLKGLAAMQWGDHIDSDALSQCLSVSAPNTAGTPEDAVLVAQLTHNTALCTNTDEQFTLLLIIRGVIDMCNEQLKVGGVCLAALINEGLLLMHKTHTLETTASLTYGVRPMLVYLHKICVSLKNDDPETAFASCLETAAIVDALPRKDETPTEASAEEMTTKEVDFHAVTYEFLTMSLSIYEEHLANTKDELNALLRLIYCFQNRIRNLSSDLYSKLVARVCNYCTRLLSPYDQTTTILRCTLLFVSGPGENSTHAFECLKRCVRLATTTASSSIPVPTILDEVLSVAQALRNCGHEIPEEWTSEVIARKQVTERTRQQNLQQPSPMTDLTTKYATSSLFL